MARGRGGGQVINARQPNRLNACSVSETSHMIDKSAAEHEVKMVMRRVQLRDGPCEAHRISIVGTRRVTTAGKGDGSSWTSVESIRWPDECSSAVRVFDIRTRRTLMMRQDSAIDATHCGRGEFFKGTARARG